MSTLCACRCWGKVFAAERRVAGGRCYHVHCFTCDTCGRGLEPATARADREEGGLRCGHCCNNNNNTSGVAADVTLIKPSKG